MADVFSSIYDYLQAPYAAREAAGQVVTPGAFDYGGAYKALQAPYEARQAQLAANSSGPAQATKTARANYSPVGPGTVPAGGYSYLDDMVAASTPSVPTRLLPSSPNVILPRSVGLPPTVLAYGQPGRNYGTGAQMAIERATTPPRPPKPPLGSLLMAALGMSGGPLFLRGDPGQTDWSKTNVSTTDVFGRPLSPTIQAALSAPAQPRAAPPMPPPMQQQPGAAFLQAQGQNTTGLTAGELANNFKKSMGKLL